MGMGKKILYQIDSVKGLAVNVNISGSKKRAGKPTLFNSLFALKITG